MQPQPPPQPLDEPKQKIQKHLTNIRRDARARIVQQMRNQMYFETQPIEKVAAGLGLLPKEAGEYTILEVLGGCYEELLGVCGAMGEEGDGGSRIDRHVNFWAYLLQEFYRQKLTINEDLQYFFTKFLTLNPYRQLARNKMLQLKVLNTLQVAMVPARASTKFKQQILKWVAGTDALTLIYNSLPNYFLSPACYPNIYEILKQCLKLLSREKFVQTCESLKYLLKTADFDDTYVLYAEQSDIMVYLLVGLTRYVEDYNVEVEADAVVYLMDSYNNLIFDYARMGVALLAVRMVICRREQNVVKGLEILKFIAEVEDSQVIYFLLQDRQLNDAGLWSTMFNTEQILLSPSISIKRQAYTILTCMLSNGNYRCCELLNRKLLHFQNQELLELISYGLRMEEDATILKNVLTMLSVLLYYSRNFQENSEEDQRQRENEKENKINFLHEIEKKIVNLEIDQDVKKLLMHRNSDLAADAGKICSSIQYILNPLELTQ